MKLIPTLLMALLATASFAHGDVVTDWNETALLAIKTDRTAPPKAARALAMMHVAIYDAVNGVTQTHEPYFVPGKPAEGASPEAAASVAARLVLLRLFPTQQATFDATYNKVLRAIPQSEGKRASIDWGEHVAQTLLAYRAEDGAQATVIYASRNPIGVWQPTEPTFAKPALPQWRREAFHHDQRGAVSTSHAARAYECGLRRGFQQDQRTRREEQHDADSRTNNDRTVLGGRSRHGDSAGTLERDRPRTRRAARQHDGRKCAPLRASEHR